jgi:symplekin
VLSVHFRNLFEELLKFHGSRHATSVNLMTCMGSIVIIAKLRPSFMGRVVSAIEKLNGNYEIIMDYKYL